jgi:hypothetical protein
MIEWYLCLKEGDLLNTQIGLLTPLDKNKNENTDALNFRTYCNHLLTVEYSELMQRLTTSIDVCECADNMPLFRIDNALWDTGSLTSAISFEMARKFGLKPIDDGVCVTASGQIAVSYYLLDIHISDDMVFKNIKVAGVSLKNNGVDFLIGMDVISQGKFSINNSQGKTIFAFEAIGQ